MKDYKLTLIGACLLVFVIPIIVFAQGASGSEVLTNDKVITMVKAAREVAYEKIGPGVYKVTPKVDLAEGEYGFYNGGAGPSGGAKIFDFGIKLPR